ncbi:MAG: adenine phosphoribosyltransferase [Verrucomicrobiales bacterium]|nr:adenine phosphoribosyltransferase [Verrucomicrobiales bacterium]|tara:strand:+ start:70347 stop:70877 length:531 start_codon:yes stop_codon:yes gene_type:complete
MSAVTATEIEAAIRNVPDFPQPGIQFKDITPVLGNARLFAGAVDLMTAKHAGAGIDACVGIDARGFIFAAAAAKQLGAAFVPIRKKGKLPWKTHEESYSLEYGEATVAIHQDALQPGARVLLLDDLLATGGTAAAAANLLQKIDAEIVEVGFLIELGFLNGREKMNGAPISSLITY